MQQMAPDIFVRILRGMGACRKKPAQPASGTLSWMTPSETLLRLCLGGFGKIFAKQRLLLAFVRFHGPIFETEKPFENVCTTRGLPVVGCFALGMYIVGDPTNRSESMLCVMTNHFLAG